MKAYKFAHASLTVKPGATINIVNADAAPHNVVDENYGINSGNVNANGSGTVKAPDKAGAYKYVCTYHPGMEATLVVS